MKGMKGKLLHKLKSIKPIGQLKQDRILLVGAADGFVESLAKIPIFKSQKHPDDRHKCRDTCVVVDQEHDVIDVAELMKDLQDDDMEVDEDKENIGPFVEPEHDGAVKNSRPTNPLSEIDVSTFRRPDLNSGTLFDPNLLAAFEEAVKEHVRTSEAERQPRIDKANVQPSKQDARIEQVNLESLEKQARIEEEPPLKTRRIEEENDDNVDPLLAFEEKCPPGGSDSVILYTTTLRGVRKTFEDCSSIRFLLESFRVTFFERDVSMHAEYKEELWRVLEGKVLPPRLFIKGRYIGGAEEVLRLHEQGHFKVLLQGVPKDPCGGHCEGCCGFRFVLCFHCNGSHRLIEEDGLSRICKDCNENGLIICPLCC